MTVSGSAPSYGERSWIDPVTNVTLLSKVALHREITNFLGFGSFPLAALPCFLHEFTHHWCFLSPVGTALSLLYLRARRAAITSTVDSGVDLFAVADDVNRYEAAVAMMQPLAEGLALFAEFDFLPQHKSDVVSPLSMWLFMGFSATLSNTPDPEPAMPIVRKSPDPEQATQIVRKLLGHVRLSEHYARRKSDSLMSSFRCAEGGYLPGYLFVKNLWMHASSHCSTFSDTEFFLIFFRRFFYGDRGFVAALLDRGLSGTEALNRVIGYFQQRLSHFATLNFTEEARKLEQEAKAANPEAEGPAPLPIGTPPDLHDQGERALVRELVALQVDHVSSLADGLKRVDAWTIAQRKLMCIGSLDVAVRVEKTGWCAIDFRGSWLLTCQADPGSDLGVFEGTADLYIDVQNFKKAFTVSSSGKRIATGFLTPVDDKYAAQFKRYEASRREYLRRQSLSSSTLEAVLQGHAVRAIVEHQREFSKSAADKVYFERALCHLPGVSIGDAVAAMAEDGLLGLFEGDLELLDRLSMLSLVCSFATDFGILERFIAAIGGNLRQIVEFVRKVEKKYQIQLIVADEDVVFCYF